MSTGSFSFFGGAIYVTEKKVHLEPAHAENLPEVIPKRRHHRSWHIFPNIGNLCRFSSDSILIIRACRSVGKSFRSAVQRFDGY